MKYNQIRVFSVPFEGGSQDRIIENVKAKIDPFVKELIVENFDYVVELENTTSGTMTIDRNDCNYVEINSTLFPNKPITYWFMDKVATVQSDEGFTYDITLDVIATFGLDVMGNLNDKNVYINRMHQDRYKVKGDNLLINKNHYGLINSDFRVSDTKGMTLEHGGSGVQRYSLVDKTSAQVGGESVQITKNDLQDLYNRIKADDTLSAVAFLNVRFYYDMNTRTFILHGDTDIQGGGGTVEWEYNTGTKKLIFSNFANKTDMSYLSFTSGSFGQIGVGDDEYFINLSNNNGFSVYENNFIFEGNEVIFMGEHIYGKVGVDGNNNANIDATNYAVDKSSVRTTFYTDGAFYGVSPNGDKILKEVNDAWVEYLDVDPQISTLLSFGIKKGNTWCFVSSESNTFYYYDEGTQTWDINNNGYKIVNGLSVDYDYHWNTEGVWIQPKPVINALGTNLFVVGNLFESVALQNFSVISEDENNVVNVGATNMLLADNTNNSTHDDEQKLQKIIVNNVYEETTQSGTKKIWYIYALVNISGNPELNSNLLIGNDNFRRSVLAPVDISNNSGGSNHITEFEKLPNEKVISIFKSPFKFNTYFDHTTTPRQWYNECVPATYDSGNNNVKANFYYFRDISSIQKNFSVNYFNTKITKNILEDLLNRELKVSKNEFQDIITKNDYSRLKTLEIGLLNQDISPILVYLNDQEIELDIVNYLNNPINEINYGIDELGLAVDMKLSENQYVNWDENKLITYHASSASTYLNNNKYSIDAQKEGVRLQMQMQLEQNKLNESQMFSGGIIGAGLSALNPGTWTSFARNSGLRDNIKDIAQNDKAKIDASIKDASAQPPYTHSGNIKTISDMLFKQFKWKYNWVRKIPNEILLKKIYFYIQKYGYNVENWETFNSELWRSRSVWNYLKIESINDFLDGLEIDNGVKDELDREFGRGIRIFHKDDLVIDYTIPNPETKLLP